jgi:hypothetical protein
MLTVCHRFPALSFLQAKVVLSQQLDGCWQQYQHAMQGCGFPAGDGQQLLPSAAIFAACSAEQHAAAGRPAAAAGDAAAAASSSGSWQGAGDGLWPYLHSFYFQDRGKRLPRWVLDGDGASAT